MMRQIVHITAILLISLLLLSCSKEETTAKNELSPVAKSQATNPARENAARPAVKSMNASAVDLEGNKRLMSEWVGKKPVVVNFWGTWCPPCRREIPDLVRLYDEYHIKGVEIVSLAIERSAGPQEVKAFSQQAGMKWVMLMANQDVAQAFNAGASVPTTIFFDAAGNEVGRFVGARSYQDFKPVFQKISGT